MKIRKCYEQLDFAPDGVHGRKANEKWKFAKLFHMFNFDFFFSFYRHTAHFYSVIVCLYYKFPIFNNVMKKLKFSISWKSALYSNILFVKREKYFSMKHIPNIILFPSFFPKFFFNWMSNDNEWENGIPCIIH